MPEGWGLGFGFIVIDHLKRNRSKGHEGCQASQKLGGYCQLQES